MRAILSLALVLSACAGSDYPLPIAVGQTHADVWLTSARIAKPQAPQPIAQPWRAESIDPEIFAILFAVHEREIAEGRMAQENASDPGLQKLADLLVGDHVEALERERALAQSLDMTSWDTGISRRLRRDSKEKTARLDNVRGLRFDERYSAAVVNQQVEILHIIDAKLLPNVGSRELERALQTDRANAVVHLGEAREVQRRLQ